MLQSDLFCFCTFSLRLLSGPQVPSSEASVSWWWSSSGLYRKPEGENYLTPLKTSKDGERKQSPVNRIKQRLLNKTLNTLPPHLRDKHDQNRRWKSAKKFSSFCEISCNVCLIWMRMIVLRCQKKSKFGGSTRLISTLKRTHIIYVAGIHNQDHGQNMHYPKHITLCCFFSPQFYDVFALLLISLGYQERKNHWQNWLSVSTKPPQPTAWRSVLRRPSWWQTTPAASTTRLKLMDRSFRQSSNLAQVCLTRVPILIAQTTASLTRLKVSSLVVWAESTTKCNITDN